MAKAKKSNKILWRIHNWTGLYVGIVIGILSLTGALAVFIPEIESWIHLNNLQVTAVRKNKAPVSPVLHQLKNQFHDDRLLAIYPPASEGKPMEFDFYSFKSRTDSKRTKVFVDPGTGKIIHHVDHLNSVPNYLRQVHVRLMDGFYGRQLVGLAGIGLVVISITGLLIYGDFMKKQFFGVIRHGKNMRILFADWHKLVGIVALVFNLMIAFTGAWLGLQPRLMKWTGMEIPNAYLRDEKPLTPEEDERFEFDYYLALEKSQQAIDNFIPVMVTPSSDGSATLEIRGDLKGNIYEPHINKVVLDKGSLDVLFQYDISKQNFWHRLYFIQEGLHFGRFAGIGVKIAYFLLGLTSGFLSISGFVIYLKRKEKKNGSRLNAGKTVFLYSMGTVAVLILLGLATTLIGYNYVTMIITPLVYLFLIAFIGYQTYRKVIKNKRDRDKTKKWEYA